MEEHIKILPKYRVPKSKNNRKRTQEEYINDVKNSNPNIEVIGNYINCNTKCLHKCKICGKEWMTLPSNILKGYGCKGCSIRAYDKKHPRQRLTLRKTHDEYVKELSEANPNIEILDTYITGEHKNKFRCKICGNTWYTKPNSYTSHKGSGCKLCYYRKLSKIQRKTNEDFLAELNIINPNIEPLSEYVKNNSKILVRCRMCNREWLCFPSGLLQGHGCECNKRKTHDEYLCELKSITNNIVPIEKYIDALTPISHKCLVCNYIWEIQPAYVSRKNNIIYCPNCNNIYSKGERLIEKYLIDHNIKYKRQYKYEVLKGVGNKLLSYDFYLPTLNILIEYQGRQHEEIVEYFGGLKSFIKQQIHDIRKRKYAKEHGIKLITVWYSQIDDIHEILTHYIKNLNLESLTTAG